MTCASASDCWAIGDYFTGTTYYQALIDSYNGTTWSTDLAAGENQSTTQTNQLNGVTCVSASDCWAVGYYYAGTYYQALIDTYNGTSWSTDLAAGENLSTTQTNHLNGVTCISASDCWSIGSYTNAGGYLQVLIDRYPDVYTFQATFIISGGALALVSAPANVTFTPLTLDGLNQTSSASQLLDIGDATGSGNGWDVTMSSTQFTNGSQTLPFADFTVVSTPTVACDAGSGCTTATLGALYPYTLSAGTTKLISAAALTGMGAQTVAIPWSADISSGTYAGTYASTWTVTLASAPSRCVTLGIPQRDVTDRAVSLSQ